MFQINGKLTNKISVEDRAVQYGDGVFETIAAVSYTHLTLPTNREV